MVLPRRVSLKSGALVVQRSFFVLFLAVRVRVTGTTQAIGGVYKKRSFFCILTLDVFALVCYYNSTEIGKVERLSRTLHESYYMKYHLSNKS